MKIKLVYTDSLTGEKCTHMVTTPSFTGESVVTALNEWERAEAGIGGTTVVTHWVPHSKDPSKAAFILTDPTGDYGTHPVLIAGLAYLMSK